MDPHHSSWLNYLQSAGRRQSTGTIASNQTELPSYAETSTDSHLSSSTHERLTSPSYSTLVPFNHRSSLTDTSSLRSIDIRHSRPPRYSGVFARDEGVFDSTSQEYSHSFVLKGGLKNRPWATLYLQDPKRRCNSFKVYNNDPVTGMLEVDLESSQIIKAINLNLKGKVITGFLDESSFNILDHSITIWDCSMGNPKAPHPGQPFDGKFQSGMYRFPVSFSFPNHVNISTLGAVDNASSPPAFSVQSSSADGEDHTITPFLLIQTQPPSTDTKSASPFRPSTWITSPEKSRPRSSDDVPGLKHPDVYPLPSTFLERGVEANTRYQLTLCISHGKLRGDSKLKIPIPYVSSFTPPPSSHQRQSAYKQGTSLPGPISDPEGWLELPPVAIFGTISNHKEKVELKCTLSLAQPLAYARGTIIPCHLTLTCSDPNALELLGTPDAQNVQLSRIVRYAQSIGEAKSLYQLHDPWSEAASRRTTPASSRLGTISSHDGWRIGAVSKQSTSIYNSPPKPRRKDPKAHSYKSSSESDSAAKIAGDELASATHSVAAPKRPLNVSQLASSQGAQMGQAVWWVPPKYEHVALASRVFEGEIHLSRDLVPSCSFPAFLIQYAVEILAPISPLFIPDKTSFSKERILDSDPLNSKSDPQPLQHRPVYLRKPVTITGAMRTDEPIPTTFTDPRETNKRRTTRSAARSRTNIRDDSPRRTPTATPFLQLETVAEAPQAHTKEKLA